jgi:biotin carboxyl carrier protein
MEREQLDRLLAEYAIGGLSEEEKKKLFAAALADQELFNELMEEDSLREAIEMAGARSRLIDALQDEPAELRPLAAAPVLRMPPPKPPFRKPVWLAWAAGIGVVFVSGAITYMMFKEPSLKDVAQVHSEAPRDAKPFVPPPAPAQKALTITVEEPPRILAEKRGPATVPLPANIPFPAAPPPPAADSVAVKEEKSPNAVRSARAERDREQSQFRSAERSPVILPPPSQQPQPAAAPEALARRQAAPSAASSSGGGAASAMPADKAKVAAAAPPTLWRRTGDGIWIRVLAGDAIGRGETVAIRYVPVSVPNVVLRDDAGMRILQRSGRVGQEMELIVPQTLLQRSTGDSLGISIIEESPLIVGFNGVMRQNIARPTQVKIILRLR